jgi:hypothetical protein
MFKYDGFQFVRKVINSYLHVINTSLIDGVLSHNEPKKMLLNKKPERRRNMSPGIDTIYATTRSNDRDESQDNAATNVLCVITFVDKNGHTLWNQD